MKKHYYVNIKALEKWEEKCRIVKETNLKLELMQLIERPSYLERWEFEYDAYKIQNMVDLQQNDENLRYELTCLRSSCFHKQYPLAMSHLPQTQRSDVIPRSPPHISEPICQDCEWFPRVPRKVRQV